MEGKIGTISLTLFLISFSFSFAEVYNWRMPNNNLQRTGFAEGPSPDTAFLLHDLQIDKILVTPIVFEKKIFIFSSHSLIIYDTDNFDKLSEIGILKESGLFIFRPEYVGSEPIISNNIIFVGSVGLTAIDYEKGKLIWENLNYTFPTSSPVVISGKVIHGTSFFNRAAVAKFHYDSSSVSRVICLNEEDGSLIWEFKAKDHVSSSPAFSNDRVFIGSHDKKIYALDIENGKKIWDYKTKNEIYATPTVYHGRVFISSNRLYSLDEFTGMEFWTYGKETGNIHASVAYNKVYINLKSKIVALDAFTGEEIWSFQTKAEKNSDIAISDGEIFFTSSSYVYSLDALDGKLIWKYETESSELFPPVIADEKVFIASKDGKLYVFGIDPKTYLSKAEKYFEEKQYVRAKDFYQRAQKYYEEIEDEENVEIARDRFEITKQKVMEDEPRQEKLKETKNLLAEAELLISNEKFEKAMELLNKAKEIYIENKESEKLKLVEDRIVYAEKRIEEKRRKNRVLKFIIFIVIISVGILIFKGIERR